MKKLFLIGALSLSVFITPAIASQYLVYDRTGTIITISGHRIFDMGAAAYWGVAVIPTSNLAPSYFDCIAAAPVEEGYILSGEFNIIDFGDSDYNIRLNFDNEKGNCESVSAGGSTFLEFVDYVPPPTPALITIPNGGASDTLAYVGRIFSDVWVLVALVIGLPLAFYVIRGVIGLIKK